MRGSRSSPSLASVHLLPNRGAHEVGAVAGLDVKDPFYVPRASWTETVDSPLKQRRPDFDPRQFMDDELRRQRHQSGIKSYLRKEMGRQLEESLLKRKSLGDDKQGDARLNAADLARSAKGEKIEMEEMQKTRQRFRAGLDKQAADNARRQQEQKLLKAHEAAETKLRTVQEICKEIAEQERRKKAAHDEAAASMSTLQDKQENAQAEKRREAEELRLRMLLQAREDERRLQAQQDRMKAAQAHQDASAKHWADTAGKEDALRFSREDLRQDRDEKRHNELTDAYYARRELARKRQQVRMVSTLNHQVETSAGKKELAQLQKRADLEAVHADTRRTLEEEFDKTRGHKTAELELQLALVQQMAEKQRRAQQEGYRAPPASATMSVSPKMLESAMARCPLAGSSGRMLDGGNLSQRLDAAKYLQKPMGCVEVKPWVDITRSHGFGGVVGVFGGEGDTRTTLAATGGPGRLLTKTAQLAVQDRQASSHWSEGLSPASMKAGAQAAAKRQAAAARDKSDAM